MDQLLVTVLEGFAGAAEEAHFGESRETLVEEVL